jgi:hypothetical protein
MITSLSISRIRNFKRVELASSLLDSGSYMYTAISYCSSDLQAYCWFDLIEKLSQEALSRRRDDRDIPLFALESQGLHGIL